MKKNKTTQMNSKLTITNNNTKQIIDKKKEKEMEIYKEDNQPIVNNNILNQIDERLNLLQKEKEKLEEIYGLNENLIREQDIDINQYLNVKLKKPTQYEKLIKNIPSLEKDPPNDISHYKQNKIYAPSEKYLQTLKYEPNINDLKDEDEYEYCEKVVNYIYPSINPIKEDEIEEYLDDFDDNIINNFYN